MSLPNKINLGSYQNNSTPEADDYLVFNFSKEFLVEITDKIEHNFDRFLQDLQILPLLEDQNGLLNNQEFLSIPYNELSDIFRDQIFAYLRKKSPENYQKIQEYLENQGKTEFDRLILRMVFRYKILVHRQNKATIEHRQWVGKKAEIAEQIRQAPIRYLKEVFSGAAAVISLVIYAPYFTPVDQAKITESAGINAEPPILNPEKQYQNPKLKKAVINRDLENQLLQKGLLARFKFELVKLQTVYGVEILFSETKGEYIRAIFDENLNSDTLRTFFNNLELGLLSMGPHIGKGRIVIMEHSKSDGIYFPNGNIFIKFTGLNKTGNYSFSSTFFHELVHKYFIGLPDTSIKLIDTDPTVSLGLYTSFFINDKFKEMIDKDDSEKEKNESFIQRSYGRDFMETMSVLSEVLVESEAIESQLIEKAISSGVGADDLQKQHTSKEVDKKLAIIKQKVNLAMGILAASIPTFGYQETKEYFEQVAQVVSDFSSLRNMERDTRLYELNKKLIELAKIARDKKGTPDPKILKIRDEYINYMQSVEDGKQKVGFLSSVSDSINNNFEVWFFLICMRLFCQIRKIIQLNKSLKELDRKT